MPDEHSKIDPQPEQAPLESVRSHPIATGLGAAGGGGVGAAIGRSIAGGLGATVGGLTGAIAGGMTGETLANLIEETNASLGLGADDREIELPRHYSWEELQTLSKPQNKP